MLLPIFSVVTPAYRYKPEGVLTFLCMDYGRLGRYSEQTDKAVNVNQQKSHCKYFPTFHALEQCAQIGFKRDKNAWAMHQFKQVCIFNCPVLSCKLRPEETQMTFVETVGFICLTLLQCIGFNGRNRQ